MIEFLNTGKTLTRSGAQERTVGAALRGRPWFAQGIQEAMASDLANPIKTTGGHGGPPLQYVPRYSRDGLVKQLRRES